MCHWQRSEESPVVIKPVSCNAKIVDRITQRTSGP
jgi:hypothetical protein